MKKFLYLAFGFLFLINCSSKPSVLDARKVYENIDTNLNSGLIRISKFQKTNAVEGELAGVKFYRIEYEAEVEFQEDVWDCFGNPFNPDNRLLVLIPDSLYRAEKQIYEEEYNRTIEMLKLEGAMIGDEESIPKLRKMVELRQEELDAFKKEEGKPPRFWEESQHLIFENGTLRKKGETKKVYGVLTFNKTEKGWRGEDGNIY